MTSRRTVPRGLLIGASCLVLGFAGGGVVKDHLTPSRRLTEPGPLAIDEGTDPAALSRSNTLVDQAILAGQWKMAQTEEFRPLTLRLSASDRDTVMRRLFVAVNSQRVVVDTAGLPF
jgi:hypothetical protein